MIPGRKQFPPANLQSPLSSFRPLALQAWQQIALASDWESLARDCSTAKGKPQQREALATQPLCAVANAAFGRATVGLQPLQVGIVHGSILGFRDLWWRPASEGGDRGLL